MAAPISEWGGLQPLRIKFETHNRKSTVSIGTFARWWLSKATEEAVPADHTAGLAPQNYYDDNFQYETNANE